MENNLWHYTTIEGLMGILKSQRLWATDYRHLNDYSELLYSRSIFQIELFQRINAYINDQYEKNADLKTIVDSQGGISKVAGEETKDLVQIVCDALMHKPPLSSTAYILSFCINDKNTKNDGLLSQWRGYGPDGGYAIAFDFQELIESFNKENEFTHVFSDSGKVCYEFEKLPVYDKLSEHLHRIVLFAYDIFYARIIKTNFPNPTPEIVESLIHCLIRFKHSGFHEEKEYRFFALIYDNEDAVRKHDPKFAKNKPFKKIYNRVQRGTSVPYVEMFENVVLPIEKIIVGPHCDRKNRAEALRVYLNNNKLGHVPVYCSTIPYVEMHS